jgi:mannosyltransferase OCH1-like enzyme
MTIPKIIIQTWKTRKISIDFETFSNTWKKINPEFTYMFFDDKDCFKLIYNNYPQYLDLYESLSNIEKADIFRYLALHKYGGVYVDMDTECFKQIGPLLDLFPNSIITGFEYETPVQFLQWFIASPKGSKVMIELVEEIYKRSWFKWFKSFTLSPNELVYYLTGPVMYTYVLKNTNESISVLPKGRLGCYDKKLIDKNSYLQHYFCSSWKSKNVGLLKTNPIKEIV